MGLVILPVAFVLAAAWIAATVGLSIVCWRLVRRGAGRTAAAGSVAAIAMASGVAPNLNGFKDQRAFEKIKADCGWHVSLRARDVNGVFIEAEAPDRAPDTLPQQLILLYETVQFTKGSEVIQLTRRIGGGADSTTIRERTLAYAVVFSTTVVGNYRREQMLIVNQTDGGVMARSVEYWPAKPSLQGSILDYALNVITLQEGRQYCQASPPDIASRVREVLAPTRVT